MRLRTIAAGAGLVALLWPAPVLGQTPPLPFGQETGTRQIQGFNIVLVLGETQPSGGTESTDDLPGGAKRALNDMREFLPYKHYRVLDSQWTSCCGGPTSQLKGGLRGLVMISGRNNAMNLVHRPYAFALDVRSASAGGLAVRFGLSLDDGDGQGRAQTESDPGREVERARDRADLQDQLQTLSLQIADMRRRVEVGAESQLAVRQLQDKQASLQRRLNELSVETQQPGSRSPFGARPVIDSSFSMDPGETVVVGTSRLGGDKALIALVTAVRRSGSK